MAKTTSAPLPSEQGRLLTPLLTHSILTSAAVLTVVFRLVSRYRTTGLKWADTLMVIGMSIVVVNLPFTVVGIQAGIGRHAKDLDDSDLIVAKKILLVNQFLLPLALGFVKASALLFVHKIEGVGRWLKTCLSANMALVVITTFAFCVFDWTQCVTASASWETDPGTRCIPTNDVTRVMYVLSGITIAVDLLCALLPLAIIWQIRMSMRRKIGVVAFVTLGILTAVGSMLRCYFVKDYAYSREDPTWNLLSTITVLIVQVHAAIIIASLPACRFLANKLWTSATGKNISPTRFPIHSQPPPPPSSFSPSSSQIKTRNGSTISCPLRSPTIRVEFCGVDWDKERQGSGETVMSASRFSDYSDDAGESIYRAKTLTRIIEEYEEPAGEARVFKWI